jgi:hypothetical protein
MGTKPKFPMLHRVKTRLYNPQAPPVIRLRLCSCSCKYYSFLFRSSLEVNKLEELFITITYIMEYGTAPSRGEATPLNRASGYRRFKLHSLPLLESLFSSYIPLLIGALLTFESWSMKNEHQR